MQLGCSRSLPATAIDRCSPHLGPELEHLHRGLKHGARQAGDHARQAGNQRVRALARPTAVGQLRATVDVAAAASLITACLLLLLLRRCYCR